ncbi:MAG: mechanosensitive ion channel family protein, partial [Elusimicrobiota bacterium]
KKKLTLTPESEKRVNTITGVLNKVVYILIWAVGFIIILGHLGVSISPILTALGVFGLAFSFGAQSLVKDVISGLFIIIENQVRVGDVAIINGTGGFIEAINLRTIISRDLTGTVHVFPNGSINTMANVTKEWSAHVFDLGVAYKEDVDNVISIIKEVAQGLEKDKEYGDMIIEPIEIFGLDKFGDSAIVIKGRIKTLPLKQWAAAREFNRRIKMEFDRRGISIPFPHRRIYMGPPSDPLEVLLKNKQEKEKKGE